MLQIRIYLFFFTEKLVVKHFTSTPLEKPPSWRQAMSSRALQGSPYRCPHAGSLCPSTARGTLAVRFQRSHPRKIAVETTSLTAAPLAVSLLSPGKVTSPRLTDGLRAGEGGLGGGNLVSASAIMHHGAASPSADGGSKGCRAAG